MDAQMETARNFLDPLIALGVRFGASALAALVVLIIGLWIAGSIRRAVAKWAGKTGKVDDTLAGFLSSLVYYLVVAVVVIAVLGVFGIPTTSFAAILGAAGLAIGLALQGTLGHVASGVMLLAFRPFKIGDFIEAAGEAGTVKGITLFTTELATPDNVQIIIPNGDIWGGSIKNFSFHSTRRLDLVMGISYEDEIENALNVINAVVVGEPRALKEPEALVAVGALGDSSVDINVRVWCAAGDYWALKWDLTRALKEALDAEKISIPYPTRTIHQVPSSAA